MSKTERQQYKIAGPATWELIRAAYLGGESARALAERFGVSEHAIRKRITVEKWSKREYAAALEARGVVREKQKSNFIEEGVLREEMRVAAEAREASAREAEVSALVEQIASQDDAAGIAAALERRALAQASAAMVQGRSKEAQALASMAEMMRKRVVAASAPLPAAPRESFAPPRESVDVEASPGDLEQRALAQADAALRQGRAGDAKAFMALADQMRKRTESADAARVAEEEEERVSQEEAEQQICNLFCKAAFIANAMVHAPMQAPQAFVGLIKLWREQNLGEGEADAERAALKVAESQAAYLEGRFEDTLPEFVRARLQQAWNERRAAMEGKPVIPDFGGH